LKVFQKLGVHSLEKLSSNKLIQKRIDRIVKKYKIFKEQNKQLIDNRLVDFMISKNLFCCF